MTTVKIRVFLSFRYEENVCDCFLLIQNRVNSNREYTESVCSVEIHREATSPGLAARSPGLIAGFSSPSLKTWYALDLAVNITPENP